MVVKVDQEKCLGCGMCVNLCPEGFEMRDGKAHVKNENADCIESVISSCPGGAVVKE